MPMNNPGSEAVACGPTCGASAANCVVFRFIGNPSLSGAGLKPMLMVAGAPLETVRLVSLAYLVEGLIVAADVVPGFAIVCARWTAQTTSFFEESGRPSHGAASSQ